jgi:transcriptional regulator with XRE-family HTH domain
MSTAPHDDWIPDDTLAARLVLVRRQLGLTQRAAAERCDLTFGEWQSMEDGRQARGLNSKISKISLSLGVSRDWLMWGGPLRQEDDVNIRWCQHEGTHSDDPGTLSVSGRSYALPLTA